MLFHTTIHVRASQRYACVLSLALTAIFLAAPLAVSADAGDPAQPAGGVDVKAPLFIRLQIPLPFVPVGGTKTITGADGQSA